MAGSVACTPRPEVVDESSAKNHAYYNRHGGGCDDKYPHYREQATHDAPVVIDVLLQAVLCHESNSSLSLLPQNTRALGEKTH
jgi:hypothetical protein